MKTCVCVAIKNAPNIDLYCDHYLNKIGFDKVYLYEDDGSVSHKDLVEKFGDRVELQPLPQDINNIYLVSKSTYFYKQPRFYNWFYQTHKKLFDWIAFFDDDEYMYLPEGITLQSLLEANSKRNVLYLYWKCLKTDEIYQKDSILDYDYKYLDFEPHHTLMFKMKSIANTHKCKFIRDVHQGDFRGHDIFGINFFHIKLRKNHYDIFKVEDFDKYPHIKHYYIRSFEEWFQKVVLRGDFSPGNRKIDEWFDYNDYPMENREKIKKEMCDKYHVPYSVLNNNINSTYYE